MPTRRHHNRRSHKVRNRTTLTPSAGLGGMLLVTRATDVLFEARFVQPAMFIACDGTRDNKDGDELGKAFACGNWRVVKSLRRGTPPDASCWYSGQDCGCPHVQPLNDNQQRRVLTRC